MSCHSFHEILALLDHDAEAMWSVLDRAVELADAERARLTLAKTTDPGRLARWFAPLALLSRVAVVADTETERFARDQLARASEFVPLSVPLTTVLLGRDTPRALRQMAGQRTYDLLVVNSGLTAHCLRLRREIRRLALCTLTVTPEPISEADLLARRSPGAVAS
jgi:hypothetical protein